MSRRRALHLAATIAIGLCMLGAALSVACWFLAIWADGDTIIRLFWSGLLGLAVSGCGIGISFGVYDSTGGDR